MSEGFVRGLGVGSLAFIIGTLVLLTAINLGLPGWVATGLGLWAFLAAIAAGKP
jgi:hypothetical protein